MWQLSSQNALIKAVLNYLRTNGYCHLWSSFCAHRYTSWVSGSTAQNIFGTPLLECSSGWFLHVPECQQYLKICGPRKWSSVLGIAKSRMGPNLVNVVDGSISVFTLLLKAPRQWVGHEQWHCHDARYMHQAKFGSFLMESLITLSVFPNNNGGLLFNLVQ